MSDTTTIGPEEQKFMDWLEKEKENGLQDFHVTLGPDAEGKGKEELYAAINEMNILADQATSTMCVVFRDKDNPEKVTCKEIEEL